MIAITKCTCEHGPQWHHGAAFVDEDGEAHAVILCVLCGGMCEGC